MSKGHFNGLLSVLVGASLLPAPAGAAEKEDKTIPTVVGKMRSREAYTLEFSIKKTGEKYTVAAPDDLAQPELIERAFSAAGKGDIVATIVFKKDKQTFTLVSKGLTEDLFIVRDGGLKKEFGKWYGGALEAIKRSPDVQPLDLPNNTARWVLVSEPGKEELPALESAKTKYDEKRPELMKRFHNSGSDTPANLYYPEAGDLSWKIYRDGTKLYIDASCANRVCVATFVVEFREEGDGSWRFVRLMAGEYYKGE